MSCNNGIRLMMVILCLLARRAMPWAPMRALPGAESFTS